MIIRLQSKRCSYQIEIHNKYTLIQGDSGTGKTNFYRCVLDSMNKPSPITIDCALPVEAVQKYSDVSDLKKENIIYVIDENCTIMQEIDKLNSINAYFIIISRKIFDKLQIFKRLSVSVLSIYEMVKGKDGSHYTRNKYSKFNTMWFGETDIIITEDGKSSSLFFKHYFDNLTVISAEGKDNLVKTISRYKDKNIIVVYDSSAFGIQLANLLSLLSSSKDYHVKILDWESYEEYILNQDFIGVSMEEDVPCTFNSRENYAEYTLCNVIPYSKERFPKCIDEQKRCSKCEENKCKVSYSDSKRERDFYLNDALKTITDADKQ